MTPGTECLILFIDRYGPAGYSFLPLRMGIVAGAAKDKDERRFLIELKDFVAPLDVGQFNQELEANLSSRGLPRLTNSDPDCVDDGYYAIQAESSPTGSNLCSGDDAWLKTLVLLSQTKRFSPEASPPPVFVKCDLRYMGEAVQPDEHYRYPLTMGRSYSLLCTYRCDKTVADHDVKIAVHAGDGLKFTEPPGAFTVDGPHDRAQIALLARRNAEGRDGAFRLDGQSKVLVPDVPIKYSLSRGTWYWPVAVALLICYAGGVVGLRLATHGLLLAAFTLLQTAGLFGLFLRFGTNPF